MKEFLRRHPRNGAGSQEQTALPENVWERCPRCRELLYARELEQSGWVCSKCKYHFPIGARERLALALDEGSFDEHDRDMTSLDPLSFRSLGESYVDKLRDYMARTGNREAFIYGTGTIDSQPLVVGAADFKFGGGSMGGVYGEKVTRAVEMAERESLPLVLFSTSGGARMQEGVISLMQMAKTVAALDRFKETRLPYISVMVDPCVGGTTASYAMLGDVNIAEPGAYIGFAGPRVIEQTMRHKLPPDAATAEFVQQHGMIDMVVPRAELPGVLGRLMRMLVVHNQGVRSQELAAQHA